jgi:sugar lactone lactonase YvrE
MVIDLLAREAKRVKTIAAASLCVVLAACGGGGSPSPPPAPPPATGTLQLVAYQQFGYPYGIAPDAAGNLYISDFQGTEIKLVAPDGTVSVFAGKPPQNPYEAPDGLTPETRFYGPEGIARDAQGNLYVADKTASVIRMVTPGGVVSVFAGTPLTPGSADGTGTGAAFNAPCGIVLSTDGNYYITDCYNNNVRRMTPAAVVTTFAGTTGVAGSADGMGLAAQFNQPNAIAADAMGNLYVADTINCTIRKITPDGTVSTLAGQAVVPSYRDGTGAAAFFEFPYGIAADATGNVYVADTTNFVIRKVTPAGVVTTVAGTFGLTGTQGGALPGAFDSNVQGVAVIDSHTLAVTTTYSLYKVTFD